MSSSNSPPKKIIVLRSSAEEIFEVEERVVMESQMIKFMIEDDCADSIIPLPNVFAKILAKVIEYCKHHAEASTSVTEQPSTEIRSRADDLKSFDADFVKIDQATLFDLIMAANYLNIKSFSGSYLPNCGRFDEGKSPEEIHEMFNIENDFTPEEESAVRRENAWAIE